MTVVAATIVVLDRLKGRYETISHRAVTIAVIVGATITAIGATWTITEVGHSGARATWHDVPLTERR